MRRWLVRRTLQAGLTLLVALVLLFLLTHILPGDPLSREADRPLTAAQIAGLRARYGLEDGDGTFEIVTIKPGRVQGLGAATQAPHIAVSLFARGMLNRVVTRIYFADEEEANAADPVLARVPPERRATLLAQPTADGYAIDLRIQGERETVFFSV